MKILRFALALALIFIMAFTVTGALAQPPPVQDVEVPCLKIPVNLDGAITGNEWLDAVELSVNFIFLNATTYEVLGNRSGTIYLKHDSVDLWICIQMEDPIGDPGSWIDLLYDVSGDGNPMGTGDDCKAMVHPNIVMDVAITGPMAFYNDTDIGGTLDIQGKSAWALGNLTYEFVHPLNSGDSAGNDPALHPGDNILAGFIVGDPEFGENYGRAFIDQMYLYNLIIMPCASVGGIIIETDGISLLMPVFASLVVVAGAISAVAIARKSLKT